MTKEEAIDIIKCLAWHTRPNEEDVEQAIKALEQESILDKIRAEILEEKECAYADFERYKVDYLGQDWEDVQDSLPQDDFRYGMERCIEIIDKYKSKSEVRNMAIKALEPRKGHWKLVQRGKAIDICCSNCKAVRIEEWAYNYTIDEYIDTFTKEDINKCFGSAEMRFCPNCGAKMESEDKE